jgi:hypothetical protein
MDGPSDDGTVARVSRLWPGGDMCYTDECITTKARGPIMAKGKKRNRRLPAERAERVKLTAEESLKRLREFARRKESFVAAVRKGKDRDLSA